MSSAKTTPRQRMALPDWLPHHHVLPFILSVVVHLVILLLFASSMRWFQRAPVGFSDEPSREIGIFVERPGDRPDTQIPGDPNGGEASESAVEAVPSNDQFVPTTATSDTPPAATTLPTADLPSQLGVGPSNLPPGPSIADPRNSMKPATGTRAVATGANGGQRGSAFMGIKDKGGAKVVFVVDASGSMHSYNAMQVAKGALVSSLQALDEGQQFLIIFYDDKTSVISLHGEAKPTLVPATELNKGLARQKISGIQPGAGTDHLPPLKLALSMHPDVIYFLTDALEPQLYPHDLELIKTINGGRVRIHAIEFGQGPELESDSDLGNFLRKLARQNGGTYRYHDVTRFKGP